MVHVSVIAGGFALAACATSARAVVQHLQHFTKPEFQIHILRILLMVPIYSIQSWLSLTFPAFRLPLSAVRDCYEAYVLYQFFVLCVAYIGGELALIEYLDIKPPLRHPWPVSRYLRPMSLGRRFLIRIKQGVLQFVIVRPVTSLLAILLEAVGLYDDTSFRLNNGFLYLTLIVNVSMTLSVYCLALFYLATEARLESHRPVPKFLCIKAVLFVSFWQSCGLTVLAWMGVVRSLPIAEADLGHASTLQDFLICVEMLLAAAAHHVAFSYKDFLAYGEGRTGKPLLDNLFEVLEVQDVLDDAHESFLDRAHAAALHDSEMQDL